MFNILISLRVGLRPGVTTLIIIIHSGWLLRRPVSVVGTLQCTNWLTCGTTHVSRGLVPLKIPKRWGGDCLARRYPTSWPRGADPNAGVAVDPVRNVTGDTWSDNCLCAFSDEEFDLWGFFPQPQRLFGMNAKLCGLCDAVPICWTYCGRTTETVVDPLRLDHRDSGRPTEAGPQRQW